MSDFILSAFADEAGKEVEAQISAMVDNGIHYLEVRGVGDKNIGRPDSRRSCRT